MALTLNVNGTAHDLDVEDDAPLLWVLRDELKLTGTKFGCGVGSCGACTVNINGAAVRSCQVPVSAVNGQPITTIEGLGAGALTEVQRAWVEHQVPPVRLLPVGDDHGGERALLPPATPPRQTKSLPPRSPIDQPPGTYVRIREAVRALAKRAGSPA